MTVMALTTHGGHLGWFQEGKKGDKKPARWFTQPIMEWFKLMADVERGQNNIPRLLVVEDGWLKEEGKSGLGVKEIEDHAELVMNTDDPGLTQGL